MQTPHPASAGDPVKLVVRLLPTECAGEESKYMKEGKFAKENAEISRDVQSEVSADQDAEKVLRLLMEVYLLLEQRDGQTFLESTGSA
jgi:hypothetical protein